MASKNEYDIVRFGVATLGAIGYALAARKIQPWLAGAPRGWVWVYNTSLRLLGGVELYKTLRQAEVNSQASKAVQGYRRGNIRLTNAE